MFTECKCCLITYIDNKIEKSDLPNTNIELQKTTKYEFTNFENLYNSLVKPCQICNATFISI